MDMKEYNKKIMKIVDPHIHLWDLELNSYPWLKDKEALSKANYDGLDRSYLLQDYFKDAISYDVKGIVHIEAQWDLSNSAGESRWLQELADSQFDGMPQAIVGYANLASDSAKELIKSHCQYKNFVGIRHILNYIQGSEKNPFTNEDFLVNKKWVKNFALLEKYNLSFDLMCYSTQMPHMAKIAKNHPNIKIVLEHCGMPHDHTNEGYKVWIDGMEQLASCDNVWVKISGLGTTLPTINLDNISPYVLKALDIFGIDRCMIASNFPTDRVFCTFNQIYDYYNLLTKDFSQSDRQKLFFSNAVNFYGLNIECD